MSRAWRVKFAAAAASTQPQISMPSMGALNGLAQGRPQPKGSAGSTSSVASAVTKAWPRMVGTICSPAASYQPSKTLPMTLAWRQTCPGSSLPSAARHASLALVPVPQG